MVAVDGPGRYPGGLGRGWRHRHDQTLLEPTLASTQRHGLLGDVETLHLDRGYAGNPLLGICRSYGIDDVVCPKKRPRGRTSARL